MASATKSLVLSSLLLCFVPTLVSAQATSAQAPAARITDEQALEMMTRAIGLKASGDTQQAAKLYFEVAKSDSKHFGEAAYLLGMQTFEAKRYDLAEKSFRRAVQGNYAPAKAKLLETQAILNPASTQSVSAQSTDPKEIKLLQQVEAQQSKINTVQNQFRANHNAQISLASTDKAQADAKKGLRSEIEAILKLHKDLLALIPAETTNTEMLKIRSNAPQFNEYYARLDQSFSAQSADSSDAAIVKQVLAYQAKIEVARDRFTASSDALKKLAADDFKAQVDTKTRLRAELEATIKLHTDQLALITDNTTNPQLLKIRNSTTLFKGAYERFFHTIRPYKIGLDSFLYELKVAQAKELVIRRRMNAAKKAGDSNAWLADQAKMKAELTEQMALCSRWLITLDQYKDPEWARERLNIYSIKSSTNTQISFLDLGMKFWDANRQ